jgi:hypothetical protein
MMRWGMPPRALPGVSPIVILMAATETQINHLRTIRFPSRTVSFRSRMGLATGHLYQ